MVAEPRQKREKSFSHGLTECAQAFWHVKFGRPSKFAFRSWPHPDTCGKINPSSELRPAGPPSGRFVFPEQFHDQTQAPADAAVDAAAIAVRCRVSYRSQCQAGGDPRR